MIGLAYSVRQPEVPIDESLKRRPTVYAHMRVGALNTRIYVIYSVSQKKHPRHF